MEGLGGRLHAKTVAHPSTNRARRRATSLIETRMLPLRQTATDAYLKLPYTSQTTQKHLVADCMRRFEGPHQP